MRKANTYMEEDSCASGMVLHHRALAHNVSSQYCVGIVEEVFCNVGTVLDPLPWDVPQHTVAQKYRLEV